MTKPTYLVDIQWEGCNCLGEQLEKILELIELYPSTKNAVWYASDVDSSPIPDCIRNFADFIPKKIGDTSNLILICKNVDQFLSGVFFAFSKDIGDQLNKGFETEDTSFRDIGDAILEIRAFDTTFFEIYTSDYELARKISERFHCEISTEELL